MPSQGNLDSTHTRPPVRDPCQRWAMKRRIEDWARLTRDLWGQSSHGRWRNHAIRGRARGARSRRHAVLFMRTGRPSEPVSGCRDISTKIQPASPCASLLPPDRLLSRHSFILRPFPPFLSSSPLVLFESVVVRVRPFTRPFHHRRPTVDPSPLTAVGTQPPLHHGSYPP